MSINAVLKSILTRITVAENPTFNYPVEKQKAVLARIPQPRDDFERSYAQYRCQAKLMGRFYWLGANVISFFVLLLKLGLKEGPTPRQMRPDAVFLSNGIPENVIPKVLREEYALWATEERYTAERFTKEDRRFFFRLWKRYPFSFLFLLKCLIKLRMYSAAVQEYSPKALVVCNEYSYTSSMLTAYCEMLGITHIDVMHGEKLYQIRDSFFRYHRCYVWNEGYKKSFLLRRAEESQFIVAVPPSMLFEQMSVPKTVDYTYYLQLQSGAELERVCRLLRSLAVKGNRVAVRPHPRYTNMAELQKALAGCSVEIEDFRSVKLEESILRTEQVVTVYSTVVYQAYYNGVSVILDDVSDPEMFAKLKDLQFMMLVLEHKLLSQTLEEL